jgi:single-strand DNA-binding protein
MTDTLITFNGWAGSDVRYRVVRDVGVATFRVASTPRVRKDGEWTDGETLWYSVTAWRTLADHVRSSVRKGDPVIVHGRLRSETWTSDDGITSTTLQVEASLIGHDLNRGLSHYIKWQRSDRGPADQTEERPQVVEAQDESREDAALAADEEHAAA